MTGTAVPNYGIFALLCRGFLRPSTFQPAMPINLHLSCEVTMQQSYMTMFQPSVYLVFHTRKFVDIWYLQHMKAQVLECGMHA